MIQDREHSGMLLWINGLRQRLTKASRLLTSIARKEPACAVTGSRIENGLALWARQWGFRRYRRAEYQSATRTMDPMIGSLLSQNMGLENLIHCATVRARQDINPARMPDGSVSRA